MPDLTVKKKRPVHLDLRVIRQPIPAIASILHRIAGAGIFLLLPFLIHLLELSLDGSLGFAIFTSYLADPLVKLILIGLLWALLHHVLMGIRILLMDMNILTDLKPARATAWSVVLVSLVLTVILGVRLW